MRPQSSGGLAINRDYRNHKGGYIAYSNARVSQTPPPTQVLFSCDISVYGSTTTPQYESIYAVQPNPPVTLRLPGLDTSW